MNTDQELFLNEYPEVPLGLLNQAGMDRFLTIIKDVAGIQFLVTTDRFDVLFETDQSETIAFEDTLKHISNKGNLLEKAVKTKSIHPIYDADIQLSVKGLLYRERAVGYLFILHTSALTEKESRFIETFSDILIPWVISEIKMQENDQDYQKQFLFDLLHNHFDSYLEMNEQAKRWGWNFTNGYQLMIIQHHTAQADLLLIKKYAELFFIKQKMNVITVIFDRQLTLLYQPVNQQLETAAVDAKTISDRLLIHLSSLDNQHHLIIGTGHFYPSPLYLYRTYQEAKMAIKLGKKDTISNQIIHYDDLGIIKLLGHLRYELLADYQKEQLSGLINFDAETGEDLTSTLEKYLENNGNIKSCAASLHIHPNTLRYRLNKIESLLRVDLKNYQDIAELYIAYLIRNSR
ncbi:PucR family transcriptional regulator [Salisediminibacterium beveridgei]|uniref:Carbohydrate diacid regulator n=1 Tax=Salisediminibacterium beveridgei TaxID=632773 RepID=A0A1D7QX78_9BACI|nr:helix-turn-helix domain-containing protein [Salisediminibacterium beveridgei]AOM83610.1 Carbohydrate diacid regulator [Salisediminibacterium beveridgei]